MRNIRKRYILLFFTCFFTQFLQAQQKFVLPDVDAIGFHGSNTYFNLYTKIGNGLYAKRTLGIMYQRVKVDESSRMDSIDWYMMDKVDTVMFGDLLDKKKTIVQVDDLRPATIDSYTGKVFDVNEQGKWRREQQGTSIILKFFSHDMASVQEVEYGKGKNYRMRYPSSMILPDSVEAWRVKHAWYYRPLELEFKGGRHIIILEGRGYDYALIPTMQGDQLLRFDSNAKAAGLANSGPEYDDTRVDDFYMFDIKRFYGVQRAEDGRDKLINTVNRIVLEETFDSIAYDSRFIICKRNDSISVYNLYLEKLHISQLIEAKELTKFTTGCIEALTTSGPAYYGEQGKRIAKPEEIWYGVCGTVPDWTYTIERKGDKYRIKKYTSGPGVREERDETFLLADCKPGDSLTFMNGRSEYSFDGNSYYIDKMYLNPGLLKIQRNGKFGLVEYNYEQDRTAKSKESVKKYGSYERPLLTYPMQSIEGEVVLPVDNDSIVHSNDGLILFYKQGRMGIFPRHKRPVYDELRQQTQSYYHIVKDGKAGWLNININKEYFLKP